MSVAAVPAYLGKNFKTASPGLRFGMFLDLWRVDSINYRKTGSDRKERRFKDENKSCAIRKACPLTNIDKSAMAALASRQQNMVSAFSEKNHLTIFAETIAPFTTGLGNEHPLENGFAFLNPYGLPYLPGSGVKGVVRRAAQELASGAWGVVGGWNRDKSYTLQISDKPAQPLSMIDVLFGRECPSEDQNHVRGALSFWDVIPQVKGNHLAVEIMTPHQTHYYQKSESPHDSGSPNPLFFLTVPPGSQFTFHVICDRRHLERLAPTLTKNDNWKELLKAAFMHAFEWLGFGAKTAVGYSAMEFDRDAEKKAAERKRQLRRSSMTPEQQRIEELRDLLRQEQERSHPEKGGPLAQQANSMLRDALSWPEAERTEAAELLDAIYQFIGFGKGKRKRELKTKIAALRTH